MTEWDRAVLKLWGDHCYLDMINYYGNPPKEKRFKEFGSTGRIWDKEKKEFRKL